MTALSDLRVLDLSQHLAGPFCTKLFADFGADVIKVEPPRQGDSARRLGPFPNGEPNPEVSGVFLYLNTNKRSITLDVETATGQQLLRELVRTADIVVESFAVDVLAEMGLGFGTLENLASRADPDVHYPIWSNRTVATLPGNGFDYPRDVWAQCGKPGARRPTTARAGVSNRLPGRRVRLYEHDERRLLPRH